MGFLVEKYARERLEIKCFYLQYCKSTSFGGVNQLPFLLQVWRWGGFIQMIEFSPSNLEAGQTKVYLSTLTWARTGKGRDTILCLNVYKHTLLFSSL